MLRTVCDTLLLVDSGSVSEYQGDLDDYARWLSGRREPAQQRTDNPENSATARKALKREQAQRRQRLAPLKRESERLEAEMTRLHTESGTIEHKLAAPEIYEEKSRDLLKELLLEQARLQKLLEETEHLWLAAAEEFDEAQEGLDD